MSMLKLRLTSVLVHDLDRAEAFYTTQLGFEVATNVPVGATRWLTVRSSNDESPIELLLEPTGHAASKVYQKALYDDGIPLTAFEVSDIDAAYEQLTANGVTFSQVPLQLEDGTKIGVFDDTCGNLIQIYQRPDS